MRNEEEVRRMLRITELTIKRLERDPNLADTVVSAFLVNQQWTLKWVLGQISSNYANDQAELDRLEERAAMEGIQ